MILALSRSFQHPRARPKQLRYCGPKRPELRSILCRVNLVFARVPAFMSRLAVLSCFACLSLVAACVDTSQPATVAACGSHCSDSTGGSAAGSGGTTGTGGSGHGGTQASGGAGSGGSTAATGGRTAATGGADRELQAPAAELEASAAEPVAEARRDQLMPAVRATQALTSRMSAQRQEPRRKMGQSIP